MQLKRKLLKNSKLYLILDAQVKPYKELFEITKKALQANVDIFQLRDKKGSAREIIAFSRELNNLVKNKGLFIVNDRVDVAKVVSASGVHLGQEDMSLKDARDILGRDAIIGVSCQNFKDAKIAERNGADYIGLGSVYKTLTKPERQPMDFAILKKVIKEVRVPVFPIGGIRSDNVSELIALGVKRVAVCRDILLSRDIKKTVHLYKDYLNDSI